MEIEVFKAGTWTDSSGNTRTWTEEDLDRIVQKYNEQKDHEAPVVIGHPKDNAPAYGWVERLEKRGSSLWAKIKPTVQEFVDWIKQGLYKKVSISLYPDLLLRHVGFLGAVPPAVKGLANVAFSDASAVTIELPDDFAEGEREQAKKAQQARAKKYGIAIKEGGNVTKPSEYAHLSDDQFADPVNYRYPIDEEHIKAALSYWGMPKNREQYSSEEVKIITKRILSAAKKFGIEVDEEKWNFIEKEDDMDKIKELEEKLKEKEKALAEFAEKERAKDEELARLRAEIEAVRAEKRRSEFNSFCEELIKEGKLLPKLKEKAVEFMEILSGIGEYEFSEGKKQAVTEFQEWLKGMPKVVEFEEIAKKDKAKTKAVTRAEFEAMPPEQKFEFIKSGGTITE